MSLIVKPKSRTELMETLSNNTGLTKKQVSDVFGALNACIQADLKAAGIFNLPGIVKIKAIRKEAKEARKGINPFTKEPTTFKARPARTVVKAIALKGLKDMVA